MLWFLLFHLFLKLTHRTLLCLKLLIFHLDLSLHLIHLLIIEAKFVLVLRAHRHYLFVSLPDFFGQFFYLALKSNMLLFQSCDLLLVLVFVLEYFLQCRFNLCFVLSFDRYLALRVKEFLILVWDLLFQSFNILLLIHYLRLVFLLKLKDLSSHFLNLITPVIWLVLKSLYCFVCKVGALKGVNGCFVFIFFLLLSLSDRARLFLAWAYPVHDFVVISIYGIINLVDLVDLVEKVRGSTLVEQLLRFLLLVS